MRCIRCNGKPKENTDEEVAVSGEDFFSKLGAARPDFRKEEQGPSQIEPAWTLFFDFPRLRFVDSYGILGISMDSLGIPKISRDSNRFLGISRDS